MKLGTLHKLFFLVGIFMIGGILDANAQVTDNLQHLIDHIETGKTYALAKAKRGDKETVKEKNGYYIKIVPPTYKTVTEVIELSPALNGNLDTTNYFIYTEVAILKEPGAEWRTAKVSSVCTDQKIHTALCLLKTVPKYQIINTKFFPFKNILDTSDTDYIIPAKTITIEKQELVTKAKLERHPLEPKPSIKDGERLIRIDVGTWRYWDEVVCPFGVFNTPDVRLVQEALLQQEYDIKITNSYDEQTKRALHQFQADNLLEVGEMTDETLRRLGVERSPLILIDGINWDADEENR